MKFVKFILTVLIFAAVVVSCKKDEAVNYIVEKTLDADSNKNNGNFLATSGLLTVKVGDTTYSFNAATDSVAFINVDIDSSKYFGITAINKQHTMSFGISSPGFAQSETVNDIAGSQLLFSDKQGRNFTLSRSKGARGQFNKIILDQYMQDSVLTRGTFDAIMIDKSGADSAIVKVRGFFYLKK